MPLTPREVAQRSGKWHVNQMGARLGRSRRTRSTQKLGGWKRPNKRGLQAWRVTDVAGGRRRVGKGALWPQERAEADDANPRHVDVPDHGLPRSIGHKCGKGVSAASARPDDWKRRARWVGG